MFGAYEIAVLSLIVGAFATFAVTLFLLSVGSPAQTAAETRDEARAQTRADKPRDRVSSHDKSTVPPYQAAE